MVKAILRISLSFLLIFFFNWNDILVAGIYHGAKKPNDVNQYLQGFRDDYFRLRSTGIEFDGVTVKVSVRGMCCDAPAAAFLKNIKPHTAHHGCRKCSTTGIWISNFIRNPSRAKSGGRITYNKVNAPLRTDESFRARIDKRHHHTNGKISLIEDILADAIDDDIIDYMHLVCIGVHKKVITDWMSATFDHNRFSKESVGNISTFLVGISAFLPNIFPRKTRPLSDLSRWKATELRLELLYISPVAYERFLSKERYDHLMILHVAIKILVNREMCKVYADYAESLLKLYVPMCADLYGPEFISFNVHNLIHLPNDVRKHGCLDDNSSFPFENKLQKLKNLLRQSGNPLKQIVNRLEESEKAKLSKPEIFEIL